MEHEEWKPYPLAPRYLVSNKGRVMNEKNKRIRKPQLSQKQKGDKASYYIIGIADLDGINTQRAHSLHRMVALTFIENPHNLPWVNHKDGDKLNNNVDNLEWCTRRGNELHAFATGLKNSTGQNNVMAKLKDEYIPIIRRLAEVGVMDSSIAYAFNVDRATIGRIRNGKTWTKAL